MRQINKELQEYVDLMNKDELIYFIMLLDEYAYTMFDDVDDETITTCLHRIEE